LAARILNCSFRPSTSTTWTALWPSLPCWWNRARIPAAAPSEAHRTGLSAHEDGRGQVRARPVTGRYRAPGPKFQPCPRPNPPRSRSVRYRESFEMLTGLPPFPSMAGRLIDLIRRICSEPPPSPRTIVAEVPPEVEAICLKCLEKSPDRRFDSAAALADQLERFVRGDSPAGL
jgi:serine/threonine protein kinase